MPLLSVYCEGTVGPVVVRNSAKTRFSGDRAGDSKLGRRVAGVVVVSSTLGPTVSYSTVIARSKVELTATCADARIGSNTGFKHSIVKVVD
jgi:hypothetical protein